jgi:Bacteriocin-protection, YdeI or OmpD-Associated/Domain of unknown function (DUF1905)
MEYILEKFHNGMHYILLDPKNVGLLTKNGNKRAICRLNDTIEFHCALMPKKDGGYFISFSSSICKKLNLKIGKKVFATFLVDETSYQFEMPEELKEVLNTDYDADKIFHSLTDGNQRGIIYLVMQVKSSEKRIERALKIAEKLKLGVTSPRIILQ